MWHKKEKVGLIASTWTSRRFLTRYTALETIKCRKIEKWFAEMDCRLKWFKEFRDLTYKDRLKYLHLHSLERRRVRGNLIGVFKWVKSFNKGDINKVLIVKEKVRTWTNGLNLYKFRFRKDIGNNWFTNRVVEEWNKLSKHVVSARTIDTFDKRLDISMDEENRW